MEEKIAFGAFIQKKRHEAGFTQRSLAEQLHVTESAVSKWERGVSYPDITLVPELCRALQVSEHELITASEDAAQRRIETDARTLRRMRRSALWTLNLSYGTALLVCLIVTLAGAMHWNVLLIVAASLLTAFSLTSLPLLLPRGKRAMGTLGGFYFTLNLLFVACAWHTDWRWLFLTCCAVLLGFALVFLPFVLRALPAPFSRRKTLQYFSANTLLLFLVLFAACDYANALSLYFPKVLPIALLGLAIAWGMMLLIRYVPLSKLARAALCCVWASGTYWAINPFIRMVIDDVPFTVDMPNFRDWVSNAAINANIMAIITLTLLGAAALLAGTALARYIKENSQRNKSTG